MYVCYCYIPITRNIISCLLLYISYYSNYVCIPINLDCLLLLLLLVYSDYSNYMCIPIT